MAEPAGRERGGAEEADTDEPLQRAAVVARRRARQAQSRGVRGIWLADLSDEEVLGRLLAINLERAGADDRNAES